MGERIVVTGLGAISPLGLSASASWENAVNGVSGVGPITLFDTEDFLVKIACEVKDFNPEDYMSYRVIRRRDRFQQFAAAAAKEAIEQSGLEIPVDNPGRVGSIISAAIGGVHAFDEAILTLFEAGPRRINPFTIPMLMANGSAGLVSIDYGFRGPSYSIASACASGADGIGTAWTLMRAGVIDMAVTGGSEATIRPIGVGCFDRLGAMSRRNEDYSMTPQPFDRDRDGLVMGEGAGILVLETESHARSRGADILAELIGYAATSDAFHITAPAEDGAGGAEAISLALESAGRNLDEIDYINAHGTGTPLNDLSETRAIKTAFGDHAYNIPISSTKSMTGHMMGATGALEAVFCVYSIRNNVIPPTIHYQTPDPECDLDYVPNEARELPVKVVMSNSFGFGGHNAVLVFQEYK
jgi:3-oxoacyl-[acyl-carrier-protein] synthase II